MAQARYKKCPPFRENERLLFYLFYFFFLRPNAQANHYSYLHPDIRSLYLLYSKAHFDRLNRYAYSDHRHRQLSRLPQIGFDFETFIYITYIFITLKFTLLIHLSYFQPHHQLLNRISKILPRPNKSRPLSINTKSHKNFLTSIHLIFYFFHF